MFALTSLLLAATLAAAPTPAPAASGTPQLVKARLLVTEPKGSAPSDVRNVVAREVTAHLTRYPALEVLAFSDLKRVVELESQRQIANCDEKITSCVADLQSALGVPWAVFVEADEVGSMTAVGLSIVGADGTALARETLQLTALTDAPVALAPVVRRLVTPLHSAVGAPMPVEETDAPRPLPAVAAVSGGVLAVAGIATAVVGAVPFFEHASAYEELARLRAAALAEPADADARLADAKAVQAKQLEAREAWESYGQAAVVAGGAIAVAGVALSAAGIVLGLEE